MSALVKINGVHKSFTRGSERIDVLQGVTLDMPQGDFLALMGPSGSGKSTLLNLIGGLDRPTPAWSRLAARTSAACRTASWRDGARVTSASSSSFTT